MGDELKSFTDQMRQKMAKAEQVTDAEMQAEINRILVGGKITEVHIRTGMLIIHTDLPEAGGHRIIAAGAPGLTVSLGVYAEETSPEAIAMAERKISIVTANPDMPLPHAPPDAKFDN
jgi:hypothetical protein